MAKKEKKVKEKTLREKCEDMFNTLHISQEIGEGALRVLVTRTKSTQLPMPALAEDALRFLANKKNDRHGSLLLAAFCLVYSRILLDPTIGSVTMTEKKGDDRNEKVEASKTNKRIIIL